VFLKAMHRSKAGSFCFFSEHHVVWLMTVPIWCCTHDR